MRTLAAGRDLLVFDRDTQVVIEDRRTMRTPEAAPSPAPRPTPITPKAVLPESTFQRALVALHEKEAREASDRNQVHRAAQLPAEPPKPAIVTPPVQSTTAPTASSSLNFAMDKGAREMSTDSDKKGGGGSMPQWLINLIALVIVGVIAIIALKSFGDYIAGDGNRSSITRLQSQIDNLQAENARLARQSGGVQTDPRPHRGPAPGGRPQGRPQTTITVDECLPGFEPTSYGTCRRYVPPSVITRRYD